MSNNTGPLLGGLDPGASGGLGLLSPDSEFQFCAPWPGTEQEISDLLAEYAPNLRFCCLETAASRPGQGVASMFAFGRSYGFLRGLLVSHKIPFAQVPGSQWTKTLGLKAKKGTAYYQRKKLHRQWAQQWFPRLKITNSTADAILLAEYCRRIRAPEVEQDRFQELVK